MRREGDAVGEHAWERAMEAAALSADALHRFVAKTARLCMGGRANESCRTLSPTPDPDGLGEMRWCYACQARAVLEETYAEPGDGAAGPEGGR